MTSFAQVSFDLAPCHQYHADEVVFLNVFDVWHLQVTCSINNILAILLKNFEMSTKSNNRFPFFWLYRRGSWKGNSKSTQLNPKKEARTVAVEWMGLQRLWFHCGWKRVSACLCLHWNPLWGWQWTGTASFLPMGQRQDGDWSSQKDPSQPRANKLPGTYHPWR